MEGHAYRGGVRFRSLRSLPVCEVCGLAAGNPIHSLALAGLETCDQDRASALAAQTAEELTAEMRRPLADISGKVGKMERDAPLFFGTGDNPSLF